MIGGLVAVAALSMGCKKLLALGKDDSADAGAAADAATATSSATAAAVVDAAAPAASIVAVKNAPPTATAATTRPHNKDGTCPAGFVGLGPPTNLALPCLKQCTTATECGKGFACKDEQAFGGRTLKVCQADVTATSTNTKALAVPSPTTDRFPRNRLKDGPCPAGFTEQPGVEEHSSCARACKTDSDCHAHTCVDSDVGDGKVCSDVAAAAKGNAPIANLPKCKGEERLWAVDEKAKPFCATGEPSCSSDKDCKGKGSCIDMMLLQEDGHPSLSHNGAPLGAKFCHAK
jgi:hypothetical protein